MAQKTRKISFKFSFIIPVYNAEKYLKETVESILAQDLSFQKDIQIVFIDDGSTDGSSQICLQYASKYPGNVKYIYQENAGLSSARNRGVTNAGGKYVMFIDPDDKLSSGASDEAFKFFEANHDSIDFVAVKMILFGAREGEHALNFRFENSRVINIDQEPAALQIAGASVFFKREIFSSARKFDADIRQYGEDTKFVTELLLEKKAYGVLKDAIYFYRQTPTSIMGGAQLDKDWYLRTPRVIYEHLADYSLSKFNKVIPYVQHLIAYDLQWRIKQAKQQVLTPKELKQYKNTLWDLCELVSDDIIMALSHLSLEYKYFLLQKKHGESIPPNSTLDGSDWFFKGQLVYRKRWKDNIPATITVIRGGDDRIRIVGYYDNFLFGDRKLVVDIDGKKSGVVPISDPKNELRFLDELIFGRNNFEIVEKIANNSVVKLSLSGSDIDKWLGFVYKASLRVPDDNRWSFISSGKHLIIPRAGVILVQRRTWLNLAIRQIKYLLAPTNAGHPSSLVGRLLSNLVRA